ncbi:ribosome maturation factor RimM [Pseudoroseicyclus tamaricis]|uniref:Ribosome maturation factor RimM n=1 Tax=Pseudoroseicyclus tamaricis TaxID=2705421 RepID=A0A6B2JNP6_9RHOB|nr:ribosome maturation factor RimM [Pseudoroseicyclus tamaricis]NDU99657.1 16S rRNA processing protein RimM [Pseudoroseicyclus tamaricis]
MSESRVIVGAVAGAFGVRGEVRLKSFCAEPDAIAEYAPLTSDRGHRFPSVRLTGRTSGALTARLDGISTKEEADALKGARLYAERSRLPELPEDEYYHADLIGLPVFDAGGAELGKVAAVYDHGAGDLLEIRAPGGKPRLLPFTREAVPTVDIASGRIVADPPDEME